MFTHHASFLLFSQNTDDSGDIKYTKMENIEDGVEVLALYLSLSHLPILLARSHCVFVFVCRSVCLIS